MKPGIVSTAGATTKGIYTVRKKERRIDRHFRCKSILSDISLAQMSLITLGGAAVNQIDHYKIHEVQKSKLGSLSCWRAMLLFFSIPRNTSTHSVAKTREKGKFAYLPQGRKSDHINVNKVSLTYIFPEKTVNR